MSTQLVGSPQAAGQQFALQNGSLFQRIVLRLRRLEQGVTPPPSLEFPAASFILPQPRMRKHETIVPIILAAGSSRALPFPKALAPFGKKTPLDIAVENCAFAPKILVVLGADAKRIVPFVPELSQIVINRKWRAGQLSSLQAALKQIQPGASFLLYPIDHALITPTIVAQLVRAFRTRSASQEIVMPRHHGTDGHPVLVSARLRPEFFHAATAREVIYRFSSRIRVLNVRTTAILEDFDTSESYEECLAKFKRKR